MKAKSVASKEFSKSQRARPEAIASRAISLVTLPFRFVFPSVRYVAPFVLTSAQLRSLLPPHCFILFVHLFLSFKSVHFAKSVVSLKSSVLFFLLFLSCQLVLFIASSFCCNSSPSIRCFLPFVSTLCNPVRCFFRIYVVPSALNRFNSSLPFATSSPSFQRFHPVHLQYLFLSCQCVHVAIPSFFQVLHAVCLSLPFFQVVHFVTSFVIVIMIGVGVHKPTLETVTMVPPVPGTGARFLT